jgi:hypothetical protein
MRGPVLRPARSDDVVAVAAIWREGWADGHVGHVPAGLVAIRTPESFVTRAWLAVATGNARARRFYERQGWVDEGRFDYPAQSDAGPIPVDCHRYAIAVAPADPG